MVESQNQQRMEAKFLFDKFTMAASNNVNSKQVVSGATAIVDAIITKTEGY